MLSYKNRLFEKEDLARVKRYGRSYFSGNMELRVAESEQKEVRASFIAGLKFSKKAVERNRAKRWAREIFRSQLPRIKKNKDLLVIIKNNNSSKAWRAEIEKDLKGAMKQAGIIV